MVGPGVLHPDVQRLPDNKLAKVLALRACDAIIFRIEGSVPRHIYWMDRVTAAAIGSPKFVWEFNTIPEFGALFGKNQGEVDRVINKFRHYAPACNLAICVSEKLAQFVKTELGVKNVTTVPNGSDPEIFRPDCEVVLRAKGYASFLNVIWIGSAGLPWVDFQLIQDAAMLSWNSDLRTKIMFHIIGQGMPPMREMTPNINYHGDELYSHLPSWLAAMDVGLVCYRPGPGDYSSPLKLFDYLASGLAVVAAGQPQASKILEDLGQTGSVLRHGDAEGLIKQLRVFLENPDLLQTYKQSSRAIAVDKYNWENTVKSVMKAIDNL